MKRPSFITSPQRALRSWVSGSLLLALGLYAPFGASAATDPALSAPQGRGVAAQEGTVPRFACTFERFCMIELLPGEELIEDPIVTDGVNWHMRILKGPEERTYVVLQPTLGAKVADIFIVTNVKAYLIELVPTDQLLSPVFTITTPKSQREAAPKTKGGE